jgi:hypothetical protein
MISRMFGFASCADAGPVHGKAIAQAMVKDRSVFIPKTFLKLKQTKNPNRPAARIYFGNKN